MASCKKIKISLIKNLIILSSQIFFLASFGQSNISKISLTNHIGLGPFPPSYKSTRLVQNTKDFKVSEKFKNYIIKSVVITNKSDSITVNGKSLVSNKLLLIININPDSSFSVSADLNNDHDFSDEKIINYPHFKSNVQSDSDYFALKYEMAGNFYTYYFVLYTYSTNFTYTSAIEQAHYLMLQSYNYLTGDVNKSSSLLYISNTNVIPEFSKTDISLAVENQNKKYDLYKPGEIIEEGQIRYIVDDIEADGTKLSIREISQKDSGLLIGTSKGFNVERFSKKDIKGNYVGIPSKNKLTLLDFWGTWCKPCIELTPRILRFNQLYHKKVKVISIAYDDKLIDVKKYIKKNKITWRQILDKNSSDPNSIVNKLNVNEFPTFILIDQSNKIIYKGYGSAGFKEVQKIVSKIN